MKTTFAIPFLAGALLLSPLNVCANEPAPRVRTLIRGGAFAGANGIAVDSRDNLYVASEYGRGITQLEPYTGSKLAIWGPANGINEADDLVVSADDSTIYWTETVTGDVGRLDLASGVGTIIANTGDGANGIAMSSDGRLFYSRLYAGELYEIDPNGAAAPRLVVSGQYLNAMSFGPDGKLYASSLYTGAVVAIDVDAGTVDVAASGLVLPVAAKWDRQGRLHVVESGLNRIVRVDTNTGAITQVGQAFGTDVGLDNLTFDHRNRPYVTSFNKGFVARLKEDGYPRYLQRGGMTMPTGVAVVDGSLFVANIYGLSAHDPITGNTQKAIMLHPQAGEGADSVSSFSDGLIITANVATGVVLRDASTFNVVEAYGDFLVPMNAVDLRGDIVVSEFGTGQIVRRQRGTTDREVLAQLLIPSGLAVMGNDLYATDWILGEVYKIATDGVPHEPIPVASGLAGPEGIAAAPDGTFVVVESLSNRVVRVDPWTGSITEIAGGLDTDRPGLVPAAPMYPFLNVAVDADGNIYVGQHGQLDGSRDVVKISGF